MKRGDWLPLVLGLCVGGVAGVLALVFGWSRWVTVAVACGVVVTAYTPIAIRNLRREYRTVRSMGGEAS